MLSVRRVRAGHPRSRLIVVPRSVIALLGAAGWLALGACGSAAARNASAAGTPCAPAGASVTMANRDVQVYALKGVVYACKVGGGRRVVLGRSTFCVMSARVQRVALAGDAVAYALERCGVDTGSATVEVLNLSSGRRLFSRPALAGPAPPESYPSIGSLVVRANGKVAWIAAARSIIGHGESIEVHRDGALLDSGPGIVLSSLRLRGTTLSWRHGTGTRSASFD